MCLNFCLAHTFGFSTFQFLKLWVLGHLRHGHLEAKNSLRSGQIFYSRWKKS